MKRSEGGEEEAKRGPILHQVHPHSRKARQEKRDARRASDKQRRRAHEGSGKRELSDVAAWFQARLPERTEAAFTEADVARMLDAWIRAREDDCSGGGGGGSGSKEGRKLHAHATPTAAALAKVAAEQTRRQFVTGGVRAPDLTRARNVEALREWDGDFTHLDANPLHDRCAVQFRMFSAAMLAAAPSTEEEAALDAKAREMLRSTSSS